MKQLLTLGIILFYSLSFSQEIEVITQEKTQGVITILSYSPDGKLLASGSAKENSIKVWDINSGKIIGKLEGHEGYTTALMFNQEGTELVSSANDKYLIRWDIVNWAIKDSLKLESPISWMVLDQEDRGKFYSGNLIGEVHEYDFESILSPKKLHHEPNNVITKMDSYGKRLAIGTSLGKLIVYDTELDRVLKTNKIHQSAVKGLSFYNEGNGLITTGGGGLVHLWNVNDLKKSKHVKASNTGITAFDANTEKNRFVTASNTRRIRVWDFEGNEIFEFKDKLEEHSNTEPIRALQISPDGSTVATSGFSKTKSFRVRKSDNVIRIWDMNRGALYKVLEGQVNPIYTFDFHPTENELVTLGEDRMLTFWDFNLAEKYGQFQLREPKREIPPKMKFWSKENLKDRKDNAFDKIKIGRLPNLGGGRNLGGKGKNIGQNMMKRSFKERAIIKFSAKGSYLITKLPKDEIRYYDLKNRKPEYVGPLWSYQTNVNQMLTSPDEKYLAVLGSGDTAISIINLETKEFERKLLTQGPGGKLKLLFEANSLAFSPDGKLLAVCFNNTKTYVYETENWTQIFENNLPGNMGIPKGAFVNFSGDGKYMVVSSTFGVKRYVTAEFGSENSAEESRNLAISGKSAPLDKPSDYAMTYKEGYVYIENVNTNEYHKIMRAWRKSITHVSISPSGKFGITTSAGQFLLVNPETGVTEMLLVADGDNYIFKTSENFYKVSKEGFDLVTFRIGNRAYPFEQFDAVFNRPDLVLKTLGCPDDELMSLYKLAYEKRIKKLGLKPTTSVSLTDIPTLEVTNTKEIPAFTEKQVVNVNMELHDETSLVSYNVFINNVPIYGKHGNSLGGVKSKEMTEQISLVHGINKIQISCRNSNGYESLMQTFYVEKTGEDPVRNLYLVTVGTSEYKDSKYNLTYAVKDGKDLVDMMVGNPKDIYGEVKTKSLYNQDVTATNVAELSKFLKQSGPDDVVLVFVAGHGVLDENFDYYFGTYDMDFQNPAEKGLAYERLEGILDGIKANKKILIMDTCHSGEIDKEDVFFADSDTEDKEDEEDISFRNVGPGVEEKSSATPTRMSSQLFNDLRRGTGSTVISSAGGAEFAMESDEWKNGLFTYCMLTGLKNGAADLDGNGEIMLLEMQEYVVDKVSALSHGKQVPNTRIKNLELDFRLW